MSHEPRRIGDRDTGNVTGQQTIAERFARGREHRPADLTPCVENLLHTTQFHRSPEPPDPRTTLSIVPSKQCAKINLSKAINHHAMIS
jgi:hypothetical protein